MIPAVRTRLAGFRRRDDGVASVEFVLMLPLFLTIFMASFESGLLMTRNIMLERALDLTVRELRLGSFVNPSHDTIKDAVCGRTVLFEDCGKIMRLELTKVNTATWNLPATDTPCADRDEPIQLLDPLDTGAENEMMLIRACAVFDPIFPMAGLGLRLKKDSLGGGYAIIARSAFVNEPE
jgi:hypothetical protein